MNIYEAKTQLSKLLKRVRAGEEIVIADHGRPIAKLVPLEASTGPRKLGGDRGKIWTAADAFAPMSESELREWYGGELAPRKRRR